MAAPGADKARGPTRSAVGDGAEGITAEEGSREGTVKLGNASPLSYGGPRGAAEAHGIHRAERGTGGPRPGHPRRHARHAGAFPPCDSAPRPLAPRPSPLLVLSGFPREVSAIVKSSAEEFSGVFCCYGWLVGSVRNGVAVRHVGASGRLTGKASPRRMLLEHLGGRETGLLGSWRRRGVALPSAYLREPRPPTGASAAPFPVTPQMSEGPRCPRHTSLSLCQYLLTASLPPSLEKLPRGRASSCPWSFPSAGDRLGEGSPPEVTDACLSAVWKRECKPSREPRCTPRPASWSRAGPRCPAGRVPTPGGICWGLRLHG